MLLSQACNVSDQGPLKAFIIRFIVKLLLVVDRFKLSYVLFLTYRGGRTPWDGSAPTFNLKASDSGEVLNNLTMFVVFVA